MQNKHIVITGAASGIGAAAAVKFAEHGAQLTVLDRHRPAFPCEHFIPLDLADHDSIVQAASEVAGPIDVLCNVAGVPPRKDSAALILQINFLGLRLLSDSLLSKMAAGSTVVSVASRAGGGWRENLEAVSQLLNLSEISQARSLVETLGLDGTQAYNLSKEAVIAWTVSQTANWLKLSVRGNTVSPGAVSTGILDDFLTAFGDRATRSIARVGRPANADEVADAILFLAGSQSAWIRGIDLPIDGGMAALSVSDQLGLTRMR